MLKKIIVLGLLAAVAAGCSTIDKMTGQTDDTVLPGQREDAVPGKPQFPQKSDPAAAPAPSQPDTAVPEPAETAEKCAASDPNCTAPQDGTFSDPQ